MLIKKVLQKNTKCDLKFYTDDKCNIKYNTCFKGFEILLKYFSANICRISSITLGSSFFYIYRSQRLKMRVKKQQS